MLSPTRIVAGQRVGCRITEKKSAKTVHFKNFDELLLDAIDEAFAILGESPKTAIYFCVEARFGISKEQIPNMLEDFLSSLEKLFGLGARYLEIMFMRQLNKKFTSVYESKNPALTFLEYVEIKKRNFVDNGHVEIGVLPVCETKEESEFHPRYDDS